MCIYLAILINVYGSLAGLLICASLMINDLEHHFMCLFSIHIQSLVNCLFTSFVQFLLGCLFSECWVLRFLNISWLQVLYLICHFLLVCDLLFFLFLRVYFQSKRFLKLHFFAEIIVDSHVVIRNNTDLVYLLSNFPHW